MSLRVCTSHIFGTLPTPACALRLPYVLFQSCALDEGVQLLTMSVPGRQFPSFEPGRATYLGNAGYPHDFVVNILGLVIAVLPTTYDGGDYLVPPHAALVLPYWLLILGSGWILVGVSPLVAWIKPYCRWSKSPAWIAGIVFLVFALLNLTPSASRPGAAIHPATVLEWVALIVFPRAAHNDILLEYGFPFPCYHKGYINGESVTTYHGMEVGWKPHTAMENFCIAALAAFAAGVAGQWWRDRRSPPPRRATQRW
jgi:hypothetical protein